MDVDVALGLTHNQLEMRTQKWVRSTPSRLPKPTVPAFGTLTLSFVLLVVTVVEFTISHAHLLAIVNALGLRPAVWSWTDPTDYVRILTHVLVHGSPMHFSGNVLLLILVGCVLEWRLGLRFVAILFIVGAIASGLTHLLMFPAEARPLIGVSGVVATLFGVAAVFAGDIGFRIRMPWSSLWFSVNLRRLLLYWAGFQAIALLLVFMRDAPLQVAYWSHLAGFGVGVLAGLLYSARNDKGAEDRSEMAFAPSFTSAGD